MKDLYICTGPFHVFCCIFLKSIENRDCDGDLYIVDYFDKAKELSQIIKKSGLFQSVFFMEKNVYENLLPSKPKTIIKKAARIIRRGINYKKYNDLNIAEKQYHRIFIAGAVASFNDFIIYQHKKFGTKVLLFDDGLGSRMQWPTPTLKTKLFDYLGKYNFFSLVAGKYFFSTDKILDIYPFCTALSQCKPIKKDVVKKGADYDLICSTVKEIFQYSKDPLEDLDALYFGGGYDSYRSFREYSQLDIQIAEHCAKIVPKYAIKKHPNSDETYDKQIKMFNVSWPLEITFMFQDLQNKILITSTSAAVFNPVFIYEKEPYIIFTYRLFDENLIVKMFQCTIAELELRIKISLIDAYKDPQKISIPNTYEELDQQLKKIGRASCRERV